MQNVEKRIRPILLQVTLTKILENFKTEIGTQFSKVKESNTKGKLVFIVSDHIILQNIKRYEAIRDRICFIVIQCRWFKVILID